jgi:transposase InsO family protein
VVTPAAKRQAVGHLQATLGMSARRAYTVVGADRTSMRYRSCGADDGDLRSRLRELARQRRRFGYRRLHILLRRDGITINHKKTQRLYREEGLTVRRRKGRKRAVGVRAPASVLALPNQRWSVGFVHDQLITGRRFRVLNRPWINGQIERINQTIKEATVKHFHYESHEQLRMHLADLMAACNFARWLKTPIGLTPYEYIVKI